MSGATFNLKDEPAFELEELSYDLPAELIAQEPASVRHQSRLMVLDRKTGVIEHLTFNQIKKHLHPGDVIIVNDTKVVPSRIFARRKSGGVVRFLLIRPQPDRVNLWEAMVTPIKRLQKGESLTMVGTNQEEHEIQIADFIIDQDGFKRLIVDLGTQKDVYKLLSTVGHAPLPPYIVRDKTLAPEEEIRRHDLERYQTVFAQAPGAVAAPTAGLHFSEALLDELGNQGVIVKTVTLHVGPGTFKPISTDVSNHSIEAEEFSISNDTASAVNQAKASGKRVIAVGTTSLRALETAGANGNGSLTAVEKDSTRLYVKPGFEFQIVDSMVTNFHLSKSSLLVLVATFAGKELILKAYKEAIAQRYRFFSYGDAMLIL